MAIINGGGGKKPFPIKDVMAGLTRGQRAYTQRYTAQITGLPVPPMYVDPSIGRGGGFFSPRGIFVSPGGEATQHEMLHARSLSPSGLETPLMRRWRDFIAENRGAQQHLKEFARRGKYDPWSTRDVEQYAEIPSFFWGQGQSIPPAFQQFYPYTPGASYSNLQSLLVSRPTSKYWGGPPSTIIPTRVEEGFGAMPQTRPRPLVRTKMKPGGQARGKGK